MPPCVPSDSSLCEQRNFLPPRVRSKHSLRSNFNQTEAPAIMKRTIKSVIRRPYDLHAVLKEDGMSGTGEHMAAAAVAVQMRVRRPAEGTT